MSKCCGCPNKKEPEKLTTSKKVLFATLIIWAIWITAIIAVWAIFDRSDAAGLAGAITVVAAVVIGFYEWKAKAENLAKYGKKDDITMN